MGPARELTDWAEDFYKMPKALLPKPPDGANAAGRTEMKARRHGKEPPVRLKC